MKKLKITAVLISVIMLLVPLMPAAYALDSLDYYTQLLTGSGIDLSQFADIFSNLLGGNGNTSSIKLSELMQNPGGVMDSIRNYLGNSASGISNGDLISAITDLLGGGSIDLSTLLSGDFLKDLADYLAGEESGLTTTEPTTVEPTTAEPTTVEPTTQAPATEAPATQSTPVYNGSQSYVVPTTAPETTTFVYVAPETVTQQPLEPVTYAPQVYDNTDGASTVSPQMIIGIVILVLASAAVVVVAFILKKSRV